MGDLAKKVVGFGQFLPSFAGKKISFFDVLLELETDNNERSHVVFMMTIWMLTVKDVLLYRLCSFFNIVQDALDPPFLFNIWEIFLEGLRGTLHSSKIRHNKA